MANVESIQEKATRSTVTDRKMEDAETAGSYLWKRSRAPIIQLARSLGNVRSHILESLATETTYIDYRS